MCVLCAFGIQGLRCVIPAKFDTPPPPNPFFKHSNTHTCSSPPLPHVYAHLSYLQDTRC
jgi:hypothetical protein